jgi:hypothetical protein
LACGRRGRYLGRDGCVSGPRSRPRRCSGRERHWNRSSCWLEPPGAAAGFRWRQRRR